MYVGMQEGECLLEDRKGGETFKPFVGTLTTIDLSEVKKDSRRCEAVFSFYFT